jgi:penicillin-binding protein 1A
MFTRVKNKFLRYLIIAIYFLVLLVCAVEVNFLWLFGYSPSRTDIQMPILNTASELYTADSVLIGTYFKENRSLVSYDSISKNVVDALIATEDIRFFKHSGVDFWAIASSLFSTAQGDKRGGSTITQQLAKNLYRTRYDEQAGLLGKIPGIEMGVVKFKEWMTAYKLESRYNKNEILTMYLNTVSFGNNAYGIETAARRYFNISAAKLNAPQAALLIGMLKATTLYNPIRNPKNALSRRNIVLSQMQKASFITEQEFQRYSAEDLMLNEGKLDEVSTDDSYLRAAVLRYLKRWAEENNYDIYKDGLRIYTTIDSRMQQKAEEAVAKQMRVLQNRLDNAWAGELPWRDTQGKVIDNFLENLAKKLPIYEVLKKKFPNSPDSIDLHLNTAKEMEIFTWDGMKKVNYSTMDSLNHYVRLLNTGMMSMDPFNGEVKVWVGGINHRYYKFDHVDQAKRQAGSTFKPFVYLTALQQGMSPCDKFEDKPVRITYFEEGKEMIWEPKNADWNFTYQNMSLRHAMGRSINSVTAQVTQKVGWDKVVESAHLCGIDSPLESVPSVGLGSNDVSVFEMVKSYATFLNTGYTVEPILVNKITNNKGDVLAEFKTQKKRVLSEEVAWLMVYMLRGTMEEPGGTSQSLWEWDLWRKNNQIGGKTGTSSDYVDGWYMGMSKDLVTGVWVGNDERSIHFRTSATGEGSHTALPIFGMFMEKLYHDNKSGYTYAPFPKPTVAITRPYVCPSPRIVAPTPTDSLSIDSTTIIRRLDSLVMETDPQSVNF